MLVFGTAFACWASECRRLRAPGSGGCSWRASTTVVHDGVSRLISVPCPSDLTWDADGMVPGLGDLDGRFIDRQVGPVDHDAHIGLVRPVSRVADVVEARYGVFAVLLALHLRWVRRDDHVD